MKTPIALILLLPLMFLSLLVFESCSKDKGMIPLPMTETFASSLSSYNIYQGDISDLIPSADYELLELSSSLFVNYAKKQRLVKLPVGEKMTFNGNGLPNFPNGTILVKTFYYDNDERDVSMGHRIVETRLLIKNMEEWNVATYVWNDSQTEATLEENGLDTKVSWITASGTNRTISYHVPTTTECASCHQNNATVVPLGPTLRNLNFEVIRNGMAINQLTHFQDINRLNSFDINQVRHIVDYNDINVSLAERGRAYLDLNCAHCHNPSGWSKPANKGFDFRNETSIGGTKILDKKNKIKEVMQNGEMPYLGTTVLDLEGINLIVQYINSL